MFSRSCSSAFVLITLLFASYSEAANSRFTIGLMSELTGPAAQNGADCKRGYELAERSFSRTEKGKNPFVRFLYGDTQGDAKTGVTEFRRLTELESAKVIISNRSQVVMAINPLSKEKKIPLLGVAGHPAFVRDNQYGMRFWPSSEIEGKALAMSALAHGVKTIVALSLEDQWTLAVKDAFVKHYIGEGGSVLLEDSFAQAEVDLSTPVARSKNLGPHGLLINLGPGQAGNTIRKLRTSGFKKHIFATYFASLPQELAVAGSSAEGLTLVEMDFRSGNFVQDYHDAFGEAQPGAIGYGCFCALSAVLQAITPFSDQPSNDEITKNLLALTDVIFPDHQLPILNREAQFRMVETVVRDGKVVTDIH